MASAAQREWMTGVTPKLIVAMLAVVMAICSTATVAQYNTSCKAQEAILAIEKEKVRFEEYRTSNDRNIERLADSLKTVCSRLEQTALALERLMAVEESRDRASGKL